VQRRQRQSDAHNRRTVPHFGTVEISLRLKSTASFNGRIEPVWQPGKGAESRKREPLPFQFNQIGTWQNIELTTAEPGNLFSLWLVLQAKMPVDIGHITIRDSYGMILKQWEFLPPEKK
jgi:hypothetical protein